VGDRPLIELRALVERLLFGQQCGVDNLGVLACEVDTGR
jgi:hypothetical protein